MGGPWRSANKIHDNIKEALAPSQAIAQERWRWLETFADVLRDQYDEEVNWRWSQSCCRMKRVGNLHRRDVRWIRWRGELEITTDVLRVKSMQTKRSSKCDVKKKLHDRSNVYLSHGKKEMCCIWIGKAIFIHGDHDLFACPPSPSPSSSSLALPWDFWHWLGCCRSQMSSRALIRI